MLTPLRTAKLITTTKVRDDEWSVETEHRVAFMRFLREIPESFQFVASHPKKREIVKSHLKTFYMGMPLEREVDIVLERITNLASIIKLGRDAVENKSGQHKFKSEQWQKRGRCELCGYKFSSLQDVTLDHIVPLSLGGSEKPDNWQLTCSLCNNQKREYWGVSDLSRSVSFRSCQGDGTFFDLPSSKILDHLRLKSNPTRYWVIERDNRKCSLCDASATETQLFIAPLNKGFLLTIDNLATYCFDCLKLKKLQYCKCP